MIGAASTNVNKEELQLGEQDGAPDETTFASVMEEERNIRKI